MIVGLAFFLVRLVLGVVLAGVVLFGMLLGFAGLLAAVVAAWEYL